MLRSLRLLRTEAIITMMIIEAPVMNPFLQSIGLSQGQIGLSQALYAAVVLCCNIPAGWLADSYSPKMCSIVGDFTVAIGFLLYAFADTFIQVLSIEMIIGLGMAFTTGADTALIRQYCRSLNRSYGLEMSLIATWRPVARIAGVALGGAVGATDLRLAVVLTAVPFAIGGLLSLCIEEASGRRSAGKQKVSLTKATRAAFVDMLRIIVYALHHNKRLAWAIIAGATGSELSHALMLLLTPLLLKAGVPMPVIGVAWALYLIAVSVGAWCSRYVMAHWSARKLFLVPAFISLGVMVVLSLHLSIWTVWTFGILGFVAGWYSTVMPPIVQGYTPEDMQVMVMSLSDCLVRIMYMLTVVVVGAIASNSQQWAVAANALLFAPLVLLVGMKLRRS